MCHMVLNLLAFVQRMLWMVIHLPCICADCVQCWRCLLADGCAETEWVSRLRKGPALRLALTYYAVAGTLDSDGHLDDAIEVVRIGLDAFPESRRLNTDMEYYLSKQQTQRPMAAPVNKVE